MLWMLLLGLSLRAAEDNVQLGSVDWIGLRSCLGGKMSANEYNHPLKQKKFRGHLFVLDQREATVNCPLPRKDVIAWISPINAEKNEISFLFKNEGSLIVKRYEYNPKNLPKDGRFEIPDTQASCLPGPGKMAKLISPEQSVQVRLSHWDLEQTAKNGPLKDQSQRFSVESVEPSSEAVKLPLKEVGIPSNDQILKEVIQEFTSTISSIPERFTDLEDNLKSRAEICEKTAESLASAVPKSNLGLRSNADSALNASRDLVSIFVSPRAGHRTSKDLQEMMSNPGKYLHNVNQGTQ